MTDQKTTSLEVDQIMSMSIEEIRAHSNSPEFDNKSTTNNMCVDCINCTFCNECKGCVNSSYLQQCTDCTDCIRLTNCHGMVACVECQNCKDCERCEGCVSSERLIECTNVKFSEDCFACRNTGGLKFAIANVEVGEENYKKKMLELGI